MKEESFSSTRSHIFWTSCFAHRTKATIERLKHHVSMSFDWQNRVLASRRSSRSCHVWKQQKRQQQQQQTSVHHFERWRIDIKSRASSLCYLSLISPPPPPSLTKTMAACFFHSLPANEQQRSCFVFPIQKQWCAEQSLELKSIKPLVQKWAPYAAAAAAALLHVSISDKGKKKKKRMLIACMCGCNFACAR